MARKRDVTKALGPKARATRAADEMAAANEFIENAVESVKRQRKAWIALEITAEQITEERDVKRLSWRDVAKNLGLAGPSAARAAYTDLTGTHHSKSQPVAKRAPRGSHNPGRAGVLHPVWDDDVEEEVIREAITGRTITVRRKLTGEEQIPVRRVTAVYDVSPNGKDIPLTIDFQEGWICPPKCENKGLCDHTVASRSVLVSQIVEVR